MVPNLFSLSITILNPGTAVDRRNNAGLDWANPVSVTVLGWADTNMRRMHETDDSRDAAESDGIAYLPPDADVRPVSRLVINGVTYQVYGIPAPIPRPGWGTHHIECRIQRFVG